MSTEDEEDEGIEAEREELVEVYRAGQSMEADRAMVEVLSPEGIDCFLRDRTSHALPAPDSEAGGYFIAVPVADADRARELLRQAHADEVLDPHQGRVMG